MGLAWIDYARERRGRIRWPLIATIGAAIALGVVAKLSWDRWAEPMRARIALSNFLKTESTRPWDGLRFPTTQAVTAGGKSAQDREGELISQLLTGGTPEGSTLFFGRTADGERFLLISLVRTDTSPIRSLTLVTRLFSAPGAFETAHQLGDAHIMPLLTFSNSFSVSPVERADAARDLLVLSGTRDGMPFRFELSIDRANKVNLIEAPLTE